MPSSILFGFLQLRTYVWYVCMIVSSCKPSQLRTYVFRYLSTNPSTLETRATLDKSITMTDSGCYCHTPLLLLAKVTWRLIFEPAVGRGRWSREMFLCWIGYMEYLDREYTTSHYPLSYIWNMISVAILCPWSGGRRWQPPIAYLLQDGPGVSIMRSSLPSCCFSLPHSTV